MEGQALVSETLARVQSGGLWLNQALSRIEHMRQAVQKRPARSLSFHHIRELRSRPFGVCKVLAVQMPAAHRRFTTAVQRGPEKCIVDPVRLYNAALGANNLALRVWEVAWRTNCQY
jgi:hypothetical protein